MQAIIERHRLVKSSTPFDLYAGEQVGAGKKSIAYRVVFQSDKGTLTSEQVGRAQEQIVGELRREVGAELRE
jgi:phenylalanyl-tRNA synthetase beta chain